MRAHISLQVLAAALLLGAGCQSTGPVASSTKPNLSPHVTDVQTEATIIQMENDYIAGKNSPPPRPEQAAAMKRMQEKQEKERAAKAAKAEKERQ
jgi:CCR4-NOT transcriptional regulation complex NOT5 subunit